MCGYYEKKLLNDLIVDYNALERPVVNESEPLLLTFGITLQQIIDVVSSPNDSSLLANKFHIHIQCVSGI
jgi:hypothetical protein